MLHSEYVFRIIFHAYNSTVSAADACVYGWNVKDNQIHIVGDEDEVMDRIKVNKGSGCKGAKCDGSAAGCRNCFQMCRTCTIKCKCKPSM